MPARDVEGREIAPGSLVTFFDVFGTCGSCWHCLVAKTATRCPSRRVYGITTSARGWAARRLGRADRDQARSPPAAAPGRARRARLHGGWLRPSDRIPCRRTRGGRPRRHRGRPGQRTRRLERGDLRAARRRTARLVVGAPAARLEAARRLGVEDTLDITVRHDPADRVAWVGIARRAAAPTSSSRPRAIPPPFPRAWRCCATAAATSSSASTPTRGTSAINPHRHVNRRHATILGCWGYEFTHLHRALALMARHRERFRWRELVTREYRLAEAGQALADMERLAVVKAVLRPSSGKRKRREFPLGVSIRSRDFYFGGR